MTLKQHIAASYKLIEKSKDSVDTHIVVDLSEISMFLHDNQYKFDTPVKVKLCLKPISISDKEGKENKKRKVLLLTLKNID